jgi:hypothetical protein
MKLIIEKWKVFWRLEIISEVRKHKSIRYFLCKCLCWNEKIIKLWDLTHWFTKSCWCYQKEKVTKHWYHWTILYRTYVHIQSRCNNPNDKSYKDYWGRGIKCEWETIEDFYNDMKIWWKIWLEIDRVNNDWNYCKSNCRWITKLENSHNKRSNLIKWSLAEYCRNNNLNYGRIKWRIRLWWKLEDSLY